MWFLNWHNGVSVSRRVVVAHIPHVHTIHDLELWLSRQSHLGFIIQARVVSSLSCLNLPLMMVVRQGCHHGPLEARVNSWLAYLRDTTSVMIHQFGIII